MANAITPPSLLVKKLAPGGWNILKVWVIYMFDFIL